MTTPTRLVSPEALIREAECMQLIAMHQSLATVGYRRGVRSTRLQDVAMAAPWLLAPLVHARQLVWQAVEQMFGMELQLHVEFTALISWTAGSSLGWHADNNREYLSQREFSSVLYLNSQSPGREDAGVASSDGTGQQPPLPGFAGGNLRFKDGPGLTSVTPAAGRLVAYMADDRNVHMVEEVTSGERFTLTMWFTRQAAHSEDPKILQALKAGHRSLPSSMYVEDGTDIRLSRLCALGCQVRQQSPADIVAGHDGEASAGQEADVAAACHRTPLRACCLRCGWRGQAVGPASGAPAAVAAAAAAPASDAQQGPGSWEEEEQGVEPLGGEHASRRLSSLATAAAQEQQTGGARSNTDDERQRLHKRVCRGHFSLQEQGSPVPGSGPTAEQETEAGRTAAAMSRDAKDELARCTLDPDEPVVVTLGRELLPGVPAPPPAGPSACSPRPDLWFDDLAVVSTALHFMQMLSRTGGVDGHGSWAENPHAPPPHGACCCFWLREVNRYIAQQLMQSEVLIRASVEAGVLHMP